MSLKTLDNALELIKYFNQENPSWGVRELAKESGIGHSIVYRVLSTFEKQGFLYQNTASRKYELGMKLMEYGLMIQSSLKMADLIHPIMKRVGQEAGESVFLTWLDNKDALCVDVVEAPQTIKFTVTVGSRTPLYAGAANKTIMAFLPREVQLEIIEQGLVTLTAKTMVNPNELLHDLEKIRANGWCTTEGEFKEDVVGIGVPLFSRQGNILASLTIAGPSYRLSDKVTDLLLVLQSGAKEIQQHLNYIDLDHKEFSYR